MTASWTSTAISSVRLLAPPSSPRWPTCRSARSSPPGTVNAIYRLGDRLCIRLPRVDEWAQDLLRRNGSGSRGLQDRLSLRSCRSRSRKGEPAGSYPFPWAIYGWIDGQPYADELVADEGRAAADLAQFVTELP